MPMGASKAALVQVPGLRSAMEGDATAAQCGCRNIGFWCVELIVVDQSLAITPDSDPHPILNASTRLVPVNHRQHKPVVTAIDRAGAFAQRKGTRYHQPVITRALEVEIACIELELRIAGRHVVRELSKSLIGAWEIADATGTYL